jgi:hypothetical protein
MSEIDPDEFVIVRIPPEDALARVYVFCTSEYFIYNGLYRESTSFDDDDKNKFAGVCRQAARVVDLIRAFNPEIADREDKLLKETEIKPVPKPKDRNLDDEAI